MMSRLSQGKTGCKFLIYSLSSQRRVFDKKRMVSLKNLTQEFSKTGSSFTVMLSEMSSPLCLMLQQQSINQPQH